MKALYLPKHLEIMGATAALTQTYTIPEYLDIERRSGERYEFYNGKIKLMAGGSIAHNRISRNISTELDTIFKSNDYFELFGSDQKIYLPDYHYYVYPDAVVVTDGPVMSEEQTDALINPLLIIEVLSPGTEKHDHTNKFLDYRTLPSFKEYVLIRQDTPQVTCFFREAPDLWRESEVRGLDQEVLFKSVDVRLALALIYRKVAFADRH